MKISWNRGTPNHPSPSHERHLADELRACDPKLLQPEPSRGDPDDPRAGAPSCDYKMYKEDLPSANQTWQ